MNEPTQPETPKDDTEFALDIMKKTIGTNQYVFADQILRRHMKIDADQRVTFWGLSRKTKSYLKRLAVLSNKETDK